MSESQELIPFEPNQIVAAFSSQNGIDEILARIEKEAMAELPDATTAKGREVIRSRAYKVARSKTILDDAGKELNEVHRRAQEGVDRERRKLRMRLDALRDEVRRPLTEWEKAEADRTGKVNSALLAFENTPTIAFHTSDQIRAKIAGIGGMFVAVDIFQGDFDKAVAAKAKCLDLLGQQLQAMEKREEDARELARLRQEAAEREQREAAERAESARLAAIAEEQRLNEERNARLAREAEEKRIAAEQREREERAALALLKEREAKEKAEREAEKLRQQIARQEQAERERAEREEREAKEKAEREEREAKEKAEREERRIREEKEKLERDAELQRRMEEREKRYKEELAKRTMQCRKEMLEFMMTADSHEWTVDTIISGNFPHTTFSPGGGE